MFWLDSNAWQDENSLHHQAHHLFLIAHTASGRDEWLENLQARSAALFQYISSSIARWFNFRNIFIAVSWYEQKKMKAALLYLAFIVTLSV